jgi:hypothetical protein
MGLVVSTQHERLADRLRHGVSRFSSAIVLLLALTAPILVFGQLQPTSETAKHIGRESGIEKPGSIDEGVSP